MENRLKGASLDPERLRRALVHAARSLLDARNAQGHWTGELSSSALSTATAVTALAVMAREHARPDVAAPIASGLAWLARHQNPDGGWGDTTLSLSNLSTTTLGWAAFGAVPGADTTHAATVRRAEDWIRAQAGGLEPDRLAPAIIARYGKDRTFSVPILTLCALAGRLGQGRAAWRHVIPLPFELAACPRHWFAAMRLPVVSYALPALIAIGQARHVHRPSANPVARFVRQLARAKTLRVLESIQPANGGFLEATPLTSFVTMSLAGSGQVSHPVTRRGVEFLLRSQRADGSWPIDTNLATWVSTLSLNALGDLFIDWARALGPFAGEDPSADERRNSVNQLTRWLLSQQYRQVHPYTGAAPGGWAWTDLPGGVPDADDTSGAVLALSFLGEQLGDEAAGGEGSEAATLKAELGQARRAGAAWLLGLQNRDGGFPTFCRGWGALPFDRSSPDITAHALRALRLILGGDVPALKRAEQYLERSQQADGSWIPLWFGNQHAASEVNKVYGTSRVVLGLGPGPARDRGLAWLREAQNPDGSWGGAGGRGSIEETGLALEGLAAVAPCRGAEAETYRPAIERGAAFLVGAVEDGSWEQPAPIGFYFARLWYFERLYPQLYCLGALRQADAWRAGAAQGLKG